MKNFKSKIVTILLAYSSFLTLCSCEPALDLKLNIQNNSTEKFIVEFNGIQNPNLDTTVIVDVGAETTIIHVTRRSKAKYYDCCPCEVGELNIFTTDTSLTSTKDYKKEENWINVKQYKNQWNGKVSCTLSINDQDLE